jgi:hypothetical protein
MLSQPFEILNCTWPRPAVLDRSRWYSEPEWNAPLMPMLPDCYLELLEDTWRWTINWSNLIRYDLKSSSVTERDLPNFHLIWRLKMRQTGILVFQGEGCQIRRGEELLHRQLSTQPVTDASIEVQRGDLLEIAQVHEKGVWQWSAYLRDASHQDFEALLNPVSILLPYLQHVQQLLFRPNGPPLKLFTDGKAAIRLVVGVYSLILNGNYVPSEVYLFGEHQWSQKNSELLQQLLPFAKKIKTCQVLSYMNQNGGRDLVTYAQKIWGVMKLGTTLFTPPHEFCAMDDDILILDSLDDALSTFQTHNLIFTPDMDYERLYTMAWGRVFPQYPHPLPTARLNVGLLWLRNRHNLQVLAQQFLQGKPLSSLIGEQGFIAMAFANESCFQLSSQRYISPIMDGLPGGLLGYDYLHNPCGFASVHLCGLPKNNRLSNGQILSLLPDLLRKRRETF